ncbi:hypothetical protein [Actinocrispum wychmicini]|uniref:DUF3558 domain-containing protein n=1 Tax=Actinocrispum wychmicini TaxID=1213861 RepID=A0A4R2JJ86_9PSEU|nr:hypothetical protein [Actinocrispum wychmicini]TCO56569.1 hypothetical protein EV192_10642 [Actinocrispum wychmicini]
MRKTIAAVAVALAMAGCSSNGNGQAGGDASKGGKDACGLLTDEQINQATELGPKAHAPIPDWPVPSCRWDLNGENNFVKIYTGDAKMFTAPHGEELPGLGDKAAWEPVGEKVQATKGGTAFELWIVLTNQKDMQKRAAVRMANDVAAKLGWGGGAQVPTGTGSASTTSSSKSSTTETSTAKSSKTSETKESEPDSSEPETNETEPSSN